MITKKNVFLWASYDFANSLVSIVFFLYFAQWIVIERGVPDIYFNLTFTISALLLLFTLGLYSYLLSFTFYTPLINDISKPEKRGFVSGLGISANYLGQIAGLMLVLPLSTGGLSFFGANGKTISNPAI